MARIEEVINLQETLAEANAQIKQIERDEKKLLKLCKKKGIDTKNIEETIDLLNAQLVSATDNLKRSVKNISSIIGDIEDAVR